MFSQILLVCNIQEKMLTSYEHQLALASFPGSLNRQKEKEEMRLKETIAYPFLVSNSIFSPVFHNYYICGEAQCIDGKHAFLYYYATYIMNRLNIEACRSR